MSTPFRPKLRSDVKLATITIKDRSEEALIDPLLDNCVTIGELTRAVVAKLDGNRTAEEVVRDVVADDAKRSAPEVEHTLRTLFLLNLIEGSGTSILARAARLKHGDAPLAAVYLPESRFQCQASGQC